MTVKTTIFLLWTFVLTSCAYENRPWEGETASSDLTNSSESTNTTPENNLSDNNPPVPDDISTPDPALLLQLGKDVFENKGRCQSCHEITEKRKVGPGLAGLYNSIRTLRTGETLIANEAYIRESILDPSAKTVQSYPPNLMPSWNLSEEEVSGLVEYIKSL